MHPTGFALTSTGVRIDHDALVIRRDSLPIPGLFAAGECTGGIIIKVYVGSGNSLMNCTTFGRIAGRNAAAYAKTGAVPRVDWKAIEASAPQRAAG
jgi:succinate dehydrogenase/fumarate reductase flavoprotein subunit